MKLQWRCATKATGERAQHRSNQTRDGDKAHGADELVFGKGSHQSQPADRDHHRAAAALQDAAGDKQMDVARYPAKERAKGEETDCGGEYATCAEAVGHPTADRNEDGKAQRVAGQHRFHAERSDPQGLRDDRHGRVQNRGVERLHEKCDGDQPREKLFARCGR